MQSEDSTTIKDKYAELTKKKFGTCTVFVQRKR